MARIKWGDRKYNSYFTMEGIGRGPKTLPDKDLKGRLEALRFRRGWERLEACRRLLLVRLGRSLGARPGPREEALAEELGSILGALGRETPPSVRGGIKHLLGIIEEIVRLISRVFNPTSPSLTPCLAGGSISAGYYLRGPPQDQNSGNSGTENRIQTGPRISEISPKGNLPSDEDRQASYVGSGIGRYISRNSLNSKENGISRPVNVSRTNRFLRMATRFLLKAPGYGVACITAGTLFFSPQSARAEPGDRINTRNFSFGEGIVPTGAAFDNSERKLYYIDDAHDQIFKVDPANNYQEAPGTAVVNLESGDEYFGLGVANISGTSYLAASNVTDCELEVYNANTGNLVNSKIMPVNPKGVTFDGTDWLVFIRGPPYYRIEKYNPSTLEFKGNCGNLNAAGMTILGESEIAYDSIDKLIYIIDGANNGFYTFDENLHNVNYFEFNPGTTLNIAGAAFDEDNLELLTTHQSDTWAFIIRYEGYDAPPPTPSPSPSPTPAPTPIYITDSGDYNGDGISDIGIFRPITGLWSIRGITRTYFGGIDDRPVGGDYDNDGRTDLAVYRGRNGLWAVRGLTRAYFGAGDDIPVPGDYDGDGSCDIGVFRSSTGLWAIRGVTRFYFGGAADCPVPGYFGGGRAKSAAVFRPATGRWWVRGLTRFYFGGALDLPWAGDFAGTGEEVAGIFRGIVGLWAARGSTRFYYGTSGDCPVPGNYNGFGEIEAGLFRPPVGLWAVRGLTRAYFGHSGDLPVAGRPCRPLTPTASPTPTPQTGSPTPTTTSTPATPSPTPSATPTPEGYKTPIPTPSVCCTPEPLIESSNSGCLGGSRAEEPESLEVFWDTDHIAVRHYNAEYNCCLERVDVEMQVEGTEFRLYETEIVPIYCYCLCPYNVFSDISPVAPGEYTVSVYRMGSFWQSATVEVPVPTP